MKIEIVKHPKEIIEVNAEIIEIMKRRLAAPKEPAQKTHLVDRE